MKRLKRVNPKFFFIIYILLFCLTAAGAQEAATVSDTEEVKSSPAVDTPVVLADGAAGDGVAAGSSSGIQVSQVPVKKLSEKEAFELPVSLDLRNIDVLDALKFLANKSTLNIVPTKNVSGRVTLTLERVPFKDIFDLILRSNGLAYVKIGEIYNVMTELEYKAYYGRNFFDLRQVKVFRLQYSIPEQAFSLLDALKSEIGRVLVDRESGNVLLMDTPENIAGMEKALAEFEKKNIVEVFVLKYARAKEVEEILKTRLDAKNVGSVKADERNNQVVVQTLPERMQEIAALIKTLDSPTKEVLIEAKIVKIKLSDKLDYGIEWEGIFSLATKSGASYFGSYPFSNITAGASTPNFMPRINVFNNLNGTITSYPFSGTTSSLSGSLKTSAGENMHYGIFSKSTDFDTLMNYLNTIGQTRVLANPKIAVVNNQEAKIHIGERQAYVTTTTSTGQTTSTVSEEVQFVDVGIQLSVTPNINDDGYVTMKIKPEISSVSSVLITPTGNKIPIIDTSLTETTVMMKDDTTLLIGGMRQEQKLSNSAGLPWLSKLPIIGLMVKNGADETGRTELLVMITPHIISGKRLDVGTDRAFGTEPGKEYLDYQPITPDKTMFPDGQTPQIQPKAYRDYLSFNEKSEGDISIKEYRYYDSNHQK